MLEAIEKLLILQDRDRRLIRLRAEVANVDPQRRLVQNHRTGAEQDFEAARQNLLRLEAERKKLELEVDSRKGQIDKYSAQQWQTRKNEEYRALSSEIENCKRAIRDLDDQQLGLMEQIEAAERRSAAATEALKKARADADEQVRQCNETEARLLKQLANAEAERQTAAAGIEATLLARYERILKSRGDKVIVGVERGVCGGCHMKLARQDVLNTQAGREVVQCPNCTRILYFTPDMDVKPLE